MHWTKRKRIADKIHELVIEASRDVDMFSDVVDILVVVYFKNRPLDSSNICGKIYEDGLKGVVIHDDDIRYVRRFCTESRVDPENPRVEIIISEL